jgi:hypothetical protein
MERESPFRKGKNKNKKFFKKVERERKGKRKVGQGFRSSWIYHTCWATATHTASQKTSPAAGE